VAVGRRRPHWAQYRFFSYFYFPFFLLFFYGFFSLFVFLEFKFELEFGPEIHQ
jgi:hypothetical protein